MDRNSIRELYHDLPDLISKGVLSPETAERIKGYYGPNPEKQGARTLLMVFGLFGAVLIGLGIILLIAHNWAQFSRISRLAISIGLLLAAQLAAGLTLWRKQDRPIWRESTAALHMLTIGAAMALVGQTYHLTEDTDSFLLTWMILSAPLIYLLRAGSTAVLYCAGIAFWAANVHYQPERQLIWVLLLLVLPYYCQLIRQGRYNNNTVILSWALNICFYICFAAAFGRYINALGLLIYSLLFSANYLVGVLWFNSGRESWRMPFKIIGLSGNIAIAFILTFNDIWRHLQVNPHVPNHWEYIFSFVLLLSVIYGNILLRRKISRLIYPFSYVSLAVCSAYAIHYFDASGTAATILMNVCMLLLSIGIIRNGAQSGRIGLVNSGMLLLSILIASRFLDMNFSFIVRGLVFVFLGLGFLFTNWVMIRRKAGDRNE